MSNPTNSDPEPVNAQEIFRIEEDVQVYFIGKDDVVSPGAPPSYLRLVVVGQDEAAAVGDAPAFLQVGDWTYPLIPKKSPIYKSSEGAYLFPDVRPVENAAYVGITLPTLLPDDRKASLDTLLLQLVGLSSFPVPPKQPEVAEESSNSFPVPPEKPKVVEESPKAAAAPATPPPSNNDQSSRMPLTTMAAASFMAGAETIAHGLVYGADMANQYMTLGTTFLVGQIEGTTDETQVPPAMKMGLNTTLEATGKAVQISGYLVTQLSQATAQLGKWLMPHLRKGSQSLYALATGTDETEASRSVDQALEMVGGAMIGIGTVYIGLEHAACVLGKSLADNTVQVVGHRFGAQAGSAVDQVTQSLGNAIVAQHIIQSFIPQVVLTSVGKSSVETFMREVPPQGTTGKKPPRTSRNPS